MNLSEPVIFCTSTCRRVSLAVGGPYLESMRSAMPWSFALVGKSLGLVIEHFEPHDHKALGPGEPPTPCTTTDKAINFVLALKNGAGEPVTPPPGFQIRAALHIDGSQTPLTTDEVKWSQRVDGKRGLNDPQWDGRLLWLNVGDPATNVFNMPSSTLELSAFIYPYYGELKNRKLVIRFTAVNNPLVTPALSVAVINMSRTPNSRKTPQAKKQKTSPPLALTGPAMATPASAVGPSPPVAQVAPMEVSGPAPGPTFEVSGTKDLTVADFLADDLFADENPAPTNGATSSGYRSAPGTPPAGEKSLDGGASAEN